MNITRESMLGMMDVAMLEPITTEAQVRGLAEAAAREGYGFICIHSLHVKACFDVLKGTRHGIAACVGFPMGIIKTCSGFCPDPLAIYEDVLLIRQTIGPQMGIKAAGRMRSYHRFISMVEAGATRVGLSLSGARETVRGWQQEHP